MGSLVTFMQDGGLFMWAILGVCVFAFAISVERMYYLFFLAPVDAKSFMGSILKLVMADSIDRAVMWCNQEPNALLPRVVKAGLLRANDSADDISNAVAETTLEVGPQVNRRTGYLSMLANVSTLLGLLGTIQGLIQAFDAVSHATPETKQVLLAQGISVAMYTTFFGLVVAIPTVMMQALLQSRANRILDEIDEWGLKTVNLLVARCRDRRDADVPDASGAEVSE